MTRQLLVGDGVRSRNDGDATSHHAQKGGPRARPSSISAHWAAASVMPLVSTTTRTTSSARTKPQRMARLWTRRQG